MVNRNVDLIDLIGGIIIIVLVIVVIAILACLLHNYKAERYIYCYDSMGNVIFEGYARNVRIENSGISFTSIDNDRRVSCGGNFMTETSNE